MMDYHQTSMTMETPRRLGRRRMAIQEVIRQMAAMGGRHPQVPALDSHRQASVAPAPTAPLEDLLTWVAY